MREAACKVKCPVLILHPERDAVVPLDQGRLLASLIPDSRFVQLDTENHMPLADEPTWSRIVDEIEAFLAEPVERPARNQTLPLNALTPRERAVLEGIAGGLDNGEIAASLGLSEKTVRNHITRVFDKIGVAHRYQAIVLARDAGLGTSNRVTSGADPGHSPRVRELRSTPCQGLRLKTKILPDVACYAGHARCMPELKERAMPKFVIEREIAGAGKLPKQELQAISQKSCGVLQGMGPKI